MFVKNIYIRLGANVLVAAISFVSMVLIVRTFGSKVIGNIAYYYSVVGIFSLCADLGITEAYKKFLASEENPKNIIMYLFLKVFLIVLYALVFFVMYFFKFKNSETDNKLLFIAFAVIVSELVGQIFIATMNGRRDFYYLSKLEVISSIVLCAYNVLVCIVVPNIYLLAANLVVWRSILIVGGVFYFYQKKLVKSGSMDWMTAKRYFSYSAPIAFSSIVSRFVSQVDKLLVGKFIGITELGLYKIALSCYSIIDKFIKPVTNTMCTEIIHRINNNPSFFHSKFRDLVQILTVFASVLAMTLIFFSNTIVTLCFGAENIRSAFILKFTALSIICRLSWRPYVHTIYALEKHKLIMYLGPLDLPIMMACYYFLMPLRIGEFYLGSAALPLTESILWFFPAGILRIWILKKQYGNIHLLETILKIWLPMAALITVGYFFSFSILAFVIVIISYIAIEYFLDILTKDRLDFLMQPIRSAYSNL